ncbi:MAG: hypothetical protein P0S95_03960 [Rhabdochlamydiaceae bacterium]|nr:hypothetical protein [Candidatus Amphrikana amoebophyrae]
MRHQEHLAALSPLLKKPYFTSKEAKILGVSSATLCYYVKIKRLKRINRGVYQDVNYFNKHAFLWSDLIEATCSTPNGVICLISALAVYNLTEEIPRQHWLAIRQQTSYKKSPDINITRFRNFNLGKTEITLEGTLVPIYDKERTIIDSFRLLSRETAIKALKSAVNMKGAARIDFVKLELYAKKLRFNIQPYLEMISV